MTLFVRFKQILTHPVPTDRSVKYSQWNHNKRNKYNLILFDQNILKHFKAWFKQDWRPIRNPSND